MLILAIEPASSTEEVDGSFSHVYVVPFGNSLAFLIAVLASGALLLSFNVKS